MLKIKLLIYKNNIFFKNLNFLQFFFIKILNTLVLNFTNFSIFFYELLLLNLFLKLFFWKNLKINYFLKNWNFYLYLNIFVINIFIFIF